MVLPRPRHFSTAAKVHPSYLPDMHLRRTRRMPTKWFATIAALMATGYGIQSYATWARDRRLAEAQATQMIEAERRRQLEALNDEYGGRDTLEELERAVQHYEKR